MKYKLKETVTEEQLAECGFEDRNWYWLRMSKKKWSDQFIPKNDREILFCVSDGKLELKDYIADLIEKNYVEVKDE